MFRSLYSKIAAGLAVLFLVTGLIFIGVTVFSTDMYQQEVNQRLNTGLARQIVKEWVLMADGRVNSETLEEVFHMLMVVNPGIEIYLLDTDGRILTYSAPPGSVKRDAVDLDPVLAQLAGTLGGPPLQGDDPKHHHRRKVFSAAPIGPDGQLQGYLYVILGGEQYDTVVDKLKGSYIIQLSTWMILAGMLFAFVSGLVLFALLTGRLKRLVAAVDAFRSDGDAADLDVPAPAGSSDEIDRLTMTFHKMAGRIQRQMEALNASDKMRRELVANVSHDLRTPLATLQGYIETLMVNDDRYSRDQRREYLEIAITHCLRLNTLVGELLELARMESAQMTISPEPFNLEELLGDIVQKFTLKAGERNVSLKLIAERQGRFAVADIALIERAMENLIENALRHTPEGGRVSVEVERNKELVVSVRDTGSGIPEQELPFIFDRFYQSGPVRESKRHHAGLGLAITHKIIDLHGQRLGVETGPGGTRFYFSLPTAE